MAVATIDFVSTRGCRPSASAFRGWVAWGDRGPSRREGATVLAAVNVASSPSSPCSGRAVARPCAWLRVAAGARLTSAARGGDAFARAMGDGCLRRGLRAPDGHSAAYRSRSSPTDSDEEALFSFFQSGKTRDPDQSVGSPSGPMSQQKNGHRRRKNVARRRSRLRPLLGWSLRLVPLAP